MAEDTLEVKPPEVDFYSVLNLSRGASQSEVHERHRALSLLFHPDKQKHSGSSEAALNEFLKVQKAYQVLSDPFLREVYDVLGQRGLSMKWPADLHSESKEAIRKEIQRIKNERDHNELDEDEAIRRNSALSVTVNALSLCEHDQGDEDWEYPRFSETGDLLDRARHVFIENAVLNTQVIKQITDKTRVSLKSVGVVQGPRGLMQYLGTVSHQFSPRYSAKVTAVYGGPTLTTDWRGTYHDGDNTVNLHTVCHPVASSSRISLSTITYGRRLFPNKPQLAELSLQMRGTTPTLGLNYISPPSISQRLIQEKELGLPSIAGTRFIAFDRTVGVELLGLLPSITAQSGITILELSTRLFAGLELGLSGVGMVLGAVWTSSKDGRQSRIQSSLGGSGVVFEIEFSLWNQQFTIPIALAPEFDPVVAAWSVVIPTTAAALAHHFIIRPRRRVHRIAQIRAARKVLEEDSHGKRQRSAVVELLKGPARKATLSETAKGGLVIQSAAYGVIDAADGAHELAIDVTVPLQALVRNSQLHIPGEGSRSDLQGFSDPAPFTPKILRIHYLFNGRPHFAEIPDFIPVVLPLSEHGIATC